MSGLTNYKAIPATNVPEFDNITEELPISKAWLNYNRQNKDLVEHHNNQVSQSALVNGDFHWSRDKENKATATDDSFVEGWSVKSNEMKFIITPKYYTSTDYSSQTGSDRYVNVKVNTVNSNTFELYQKLPKTLSYFHNKNIVISGLARNNFGSPIKAKVSIGFDVNNDGVFEYTADSRSFYIGDGDARKPFSATITSPKIQEDSRDNTQYLRLVLFDLTQRVDFDLYFLKCEFNNLPTALFIDHTMEKLKLDDLKS